MILENVRVKKFVKAPILKLLKKIPSLNFIDRQLLGCKNWNMERKCLFSLFYPKRLKRNYMEKIKSV